MGQYRRFCIFVGLSITMMPDAFSNSLVTVWLDSCAAPQSRHGEVGFVGSFSHIKVSD